MKHFLNKYSMSWISGVIDIVQDNSSAKRKQQQFGGLVLVLLLLIFCVSVYKDGFIFMQNKLIQPLVLW